MKKAWIGMMVVAVLLACNNEPETTETAPNTTNVQNVNGNIPDTTSSITLDSKQTGDSLSAKDTSR